MSLLLRRFLKSLCRRKVASVLACLFVLSFCYAQFKILQKHFPQSFEQHLGLHLFATERSYADVEQENRRINVKETCRMSKNSRWLDIWPHMRALPRFERSPLISTKNRVMICVAAKVGSTFFTRWIKAMDFPGPMRSPLDIPIRDANRATVENLHSLQSYKSRLQFVETAQKVVFGRDPFVRTFAAYVDKLFSPNPTYWRDWGLKAEMNPRLPFQRCGSNATFASFVHYMMSHDKFIDFHFVPVSQECKMCQMSYDIIGKMETFTTDLDYISKKINVSSQFQYSYDFSRRLQDDSMVDTIGSVFSWIPQIKHCMSLYEMGKRMWRKFQIRGVIDSALDYPFNPQQSEDMTPDSFLRLCKEAAEKSTDKDRLNKQRRIALEEAYISVDPEVIRKMLKMYKLDLDLFGYNQNMDYLIDEEYRSLFNITNAFDWNSSWDIYSKIHNVMY